MHKFVKKNYRVGWISIRHDIGNCNVELHGYIYIYIYIISVHPIMQIKENHNVQ